MRFFAIAATLSLIFLAAPTFAEVDKIFGLSETVYIEELDVVYEAKIDTGAESASINAINIRVEKAKGDDGENKVHFDLVLPDNSLKSITMPLTKHIRIKRRASDYSENDKDYARRPVLDLTLCIGGYSKKVEANLADRRQFSKPMLIGHEPLILFGALVDPGQENLQDVNRCTMPAKADVGNKDSEE